MPGASIGPHGNVYPSHLTDCSIVALKAAFVPRSSPGWSPCYSRLCAALRGRSGSPREGTGSDLRQVSCWPLLKRVHWYVLSAPTLTSCWWWHGQLL